MSLARRLMAILLGVMFIALGFLRITEHQQGGFLFVLGGTGQLVLTVVALMRGEL